MKKLVELRYGLTVAALIVFAIACGDDAKQPLAPELVPDVENITTSAPRTSLSSEFNQYQFLGFVTDDQGANDTPAQSDLNAFTRADNVSGKIGVQWTWDDVNSWTGSGQTGDACALFDTDNDGKANNAVCVRITNPGGNPDSVAQLSPGSPINYTCGDSKNDRCASPVRSVAIGGIVCEAQKVDTNYVAGGEDGADVLAACSIPFSALGTSVTPNLTNVCSFPSGSPNSNPFDCVVTPGAGFLVIKKATSPQSSGQTFSFTISPALVSGGSQSILDNSNDDEQTALLSAAPGTALSVSEGTLPSGWQLNSASCAKQTTPNPTPTGTKSGNTVSGIAISSGETTVCTFTNGVAAPSISVVKTASPNSIPETGDSVAYSVVVTNNSTIPVTLTSLVDSVFGNLSAVGTCNNTGNLYGSIAASGTYSCAFKKALSASNAGQVHINKVTANVTSDGGPASASDTAKVTYTDVLPSITVTKVADDSTIAASGGSAVAGFNPDTTFTETSTGGGTINPIFGGDICDDAGANDQPAQVDLNCFSRADNVTGRLYVKWTWDDINSWTGSGNTGDACSLLDTNNDGNANFAFCARITNPGGDPNQIAQVVPGSPVLYKCGDKAADRCSSKVSLETITNSVCTISTVPDHFPGVGDDGADVQAECNIRLQDLGQNINIANIDLLNVCSFPSGSPNSNPFDCVVTPAAGFLVIAEVTSPTASTAIFGFRLRNGANTADTASTNGDNEFGVQAGATSPGIPMIAGTYTLRQLLPSSWRLTGVSCMRDGNVIASGTDSTQSNVTIVQGQTTTCTFNNALVGSQLITFTVTVTNNSKEAVTLYSLEDTENPDAGVPTYSSLFGSPSSSTCVSGTILNGTPYSCTFTRTVTGPPGTTHRDRVRAVGKDNELNADTQPSSIVQVVIN